MTYYGYTDASGEYYIVVDAEKCNSCGECINVCPQKAIHLEEMFIDLEDKPVAAVTEEHRKKIRYTCSSCKPEENITPCIDSCKQKAISFIWKPK